MIVGITGAVSTGKTTLSFMLSKKYGFTYLSLKDMAERKGLLEEYDKKYDSYIVDVSKLLLYFKQEIKKLRGDVVVDSHLLVEDSFPLNLLIILRNSPLTLYKRMLKERHYSKKKAYENALSEALDYFPVFAAQHYPKNIIYEVNITNKTKEESLFIIKEIISGNYEHKSYSFKEELKTLALMQ